MGITPTSGLGASHNRLTQPLGSKGLPLTLVYADAYDDVAPSRLDRYALFDTGLHQPKATGSGTVINTAVSPMVVNASITGTTLRYPTSELSNHQFSPQNAGLTTNLTPPSLNHESGALEFGQIVQDISRSHHRNDEVRSSVPFARLSLSEAGRFTGYERRRYNSGRPANHTWQQTKTTDDDVVGSIDLSFGSYAAKDTFTCSHPTFTQGGRIEAITHYAKADLPSNGLGICWGDAHNATFLTSLGSAPIHESATGIGMEAQEDDLLFSSHWSLNLGVRQPVLASELQSPAPTLCPYRCQYRRMLLHGICCGVLKRCSRSWSWTSSPMALWPRPPIICRCPWGVLIWATMSLPIPVGSSATRESSRRLPSFQSPRTPTRTKCWDSNPSQIPMARITTLD